jgi:hypothetical protein
MLTNINVSIYLRKFLLIFFIYFFDVKLQTTWRGDEYPCHGHIIEFFSQRKRCCSVHIEKS